LRFVDAGNDGSMVVLVVSRRLALS
jgi:hypothetical protein